jgi:hypothetical protein
MEELRNDVAELKKIVLQMKDEFKGLVEIQQQLIHGRLGAPVPAPVSTVEKQSNKTITILQDLGKLVVTGNTYNYNSLIKESAKDNDMSAVWNGSKKAWELNERCLDTLVNKLEEAGLKKNSDFVVV